MMRPKKSYCPNRLMALMKVAENRDEESAKSEPFEKGGLFDQRQNVLLKVKPAEECVDCSAETTLRFKQKSVEI